MTTVASLSESLIELWLIVAHVILFEGRIVSIVAHLGCSKLGEILILRKSSHLAWVSSHVIKLSHQELGGVHASVGHLHVLTVVVLLLVLYQARE
jgi:hypothetical protein